MNKNIIFIAPPAAGKGTQSAFLEEKYGLAHISTGELLREVASNGTEFGNKIADLINNGIFVDDKTMADMLKTKIESIDSNTGIIFDGYPRNVNQADTLNEILESVNRKVDYVIYLNISKDRAMKRTLGRLTCSSCGSIFNIYSDTFKTEGLCNNCNGKLERRDDDTEERFNVRFDTFLEKTQPLIDYYKGKGLLHEVEAQVKREDTFALIEKVLNGTNND
jgi:adenylate kinase